MGGFSERWKRCRALLLAGSAVMGGLASSGLPAQPLAVDLSFNSHDGVVLIWEAQADLTKYEVYRIKVTNGVAGSPTRLRTLDITQPGTVTFRDSTVRQTGWEGTYRYYISPTAQPGRASPQREVATFSFTAPHIPLARWADNKGHNDQMGRLFLYPNQSMVYSALLGWLATVRLHTGDIWLNHPELGWLWRAPNHPGWFWAPSSGEWLYYYGIRDPEWLYVLQATGPGSFAPRP